MKTRTFNSILSAFFAVFIAIGALVRIPLFGIPFTLQSFFVILAAMMLKTRYACLSVAIYILLGLVGIPIFSQGGGFAYLLQPSFGYILGFLACALVCSLLISKKNNPGVLYHSLCALISLLPLYAIGCFYFNIVSDLLLKNADIGYVFVYGFLVFLPTDILLCFLAALFAVRIKKIKNFSILQK